MKRIIASIIIMAGGLAALEVGQTGLNHLRIQPSARSQGMGGVSLGVAENPQAFFANPASLPSEGMMLSANYLPYPAGIHIGSILFQPRLNSPVSISAGAFYLNSGTMIMTSSTNDSLGTFGYHLINLGGTVAYSIIDNLSVGTNIRGHLGVVDSNAQIAAAADFGVLYSNLDYSLSAGLVVQNVAFEIVPYVSERSALPVGIGGGVSFSGLKNLLVGLDVSKPLDAPLIIRGGLEYLPLDILALRLGYSTEGQNWKTGGGADIVAGLSAGVGINNLAGISVDYAVTPGLDIGFFHRISLSYTF